MSILRDRIQLIELACANMLCAAAEQVFRRERARVFVVHRSGMPDSVRALIRHAGKVAAHYNLIPERTYDGTDDDTDE